jgi:hypothetical protein
MADLAQRGYVVPAARVGSGGPDDIRSPALAALGQVILPLPAGEEIQAADILSICSLITSALSRAGTT